MVPLLSVAFLSLGCGGSEKKHRSKDKGGESTTKPADENPTPASSGSKERTALPSTGLATIKGKVTYDGDPPTPAALNVEASQDKDYCHKGNPQDLMDPTWTVDSKTKGVANVVIWLKPPAGHYFDVPAAERKPAEATVKVGQPFCAFHPHVSVAFPSFFDGKKQEKTGQVVEVVNDAKISHNTNISPMDSSLDSSENPLMAAGGPPLKLDLFKLKQNRPNLEDKLTLKCNIHQWMTGYIWAFDHPYAAKTNPDGTYEIKNVPAGADLHIVGWHEPDEFITPEGKTGTRQGSAIKALDKGETREINFKIKK
jgi:hypothetical protein